MQDAQWGTYAVWRQDKQAGEQDESRNQQEANDDWTLIFCLAGSSYAQEHHLTLNVGARSYALGR